MDRRKFLLGAAPAVGEWDFVLAAVSRLIPSEGAGPGGLDVGVPEFIDRQMEVPYGHGAYFYLKGPFLDNSPPTLGFGMRLRDRRRRLESQLSHYTGSK